MSDEKNFNPRKIDAGALTELLIGALAALEGAEPEINRLNVFPVPDGDTGSNMRMTLEAPVNELRRRPPADLPELAEVLARTSLLGARGNSGVILSQFIRGITTVIGGEKSVTASLWLDAVKEGTDTAYAAVRQPVEGTILTVMRAAASITDCGSDLGGLLAVMAASARESVAKTPDLLSILKENGVVDAGGFGLAVIFEGMEAAWRGERAAVSLPAPATVPAVFEEPTHGYCTEFIFQAKDFDKTEMETRLSSLGGSLLFVGEDGTFRIHIHTDEPGLVIDLATRTGSISRVAIHNLAEQSLARTKTLLAAQAPIAVVAVAAGEGMKEIFKSLGAAAIIDGGQSANPSTKEIADAIEEANAAEVIVLPNNKNIILAAESAVELNGKGAAVVPVRSIPAGLAAMLAFATEKSMAENVEAMTAAAGTVKSFAVTSAVRDAAGIKKGDWLGLFDDQVTVVADSVANALIDIVAANIGEDDELLTVITGEDMPPETDIYALLNSHFPQLDVEIKFGGQPLYPLILGLE